MASAARHAADVVREMIISGELAPGVELREKFLAERLGVSRTPLREALTLLKAEGIVEERANRASIVSKPTAQDLVEIYELRTTLESIGLEQALPRLTEDDVENLRSMSDAMANALSMREYVLLNHEFHMAMYRPAPNQRLLALISQLRAQSDPYIALLIGPNVNAHADHAAMVDLCERKDVEAAKALLQDHLHKTVTRVMSILGTDVNGGAVAHAKP